MSAALSLLSSLQSAKEMFSSPSLVYEMNLHINRFVVLSAANSALRRGDTPLLSVKIGVCTV